MHWAIALEEYHNLSQVMGGERAVGFEYKM